MTMTIPSLETLRFWFPRFLKQCPENLIQAVIHPAPLVADQQLMQPVEAELIAQVELIILPQHSKLS